LVDDNVEALGLQCADGVLGVTGSRGAAWTGATTPITAAPDVPATIVTTTPTFLTHPSIRGRPRDPAIIA
jgi:hypothetical protein